MNVITNFETNVSIAVTGSAQAMADQLNISKSSVNRILKGAKACGFEMVEDTTGVLNVADAAVGTVETPVVATDVVETPVVATDVVETPVVETPAVEKAASKADTAREVFEIMFGKQGVTPKMIKDEMMAKAELSKAGASTYYYNMKKKAEAAAE